MITPYPSPTLLQPNRSGSNALKRCVYRSEVTISLSRAAARAFSNSSIASASKPSALIRSEADLGPGKPKGRILDNVLTCRRFALRKLDESFGHKYHLLKIASVCFLMVLSDCGIQADASHWDLSTGATV